MVPRLNRLATPALLAAAMGALGAPSTADDPVAIYHAFAVNLSNVGAQGAVPLDITIERWTTDEERARLQDVLAERGDEALMDALRDLKRAGSIRARGGGLGWTVQYARKEELPGGGSRVVIATDRPMSFAERVNRPLSAEYEYLVAEFRVRPDGKGQGTLVPMAKVTYDRANKTIEIENFANEPVRLNQVTQVQPKIEQDEKDKASTAQPD